MFGPVCANVGTRAVGNLAYPHFMAREGGAKNPLLIEKAHDLLYRGERKRIR